MTSPQLLAQKFKKLKQIALQDPWEFLHWCRTKDEHDQENPVKAFPRKEYIRITLMEMMEPGILFLPKSRQIMATWMSCVYVLWLSKRFDYRLSFVQSKKEDDAAVIVFKGGKTNNWDTARMSFIESHLPLWLQDHPEVSYARMAYPNGSIIEGIPQGGDMIRSKTPSLVLSDECAFQPEFADAYTAMLPICKQGGQLIALSSANPGFFAEIAGRIVGEDLLAA